MNEIKYVKGDLFDHIGLIKQKIGIAHVCNDIGHWGAGFSGVLSKHYPLAEVSYRQSYAHPNLENSVGDVFELGGVDYVVVAQNPMAYVFNMIAQSGTVQTPRDYSPPIRYGALAFAMRTVARQARQDDLSLHCPRFGAGLAGGDWNVISNMVRELWVAKGLDVTIYRI